MALNGASSDEEVWAGYDDNASYEEAGDVSMCRAFMTACRILIRREPRRTGTREAEVETNIQDVRRELEAARLWLAANDTGTAGSGGSGGPTVTRVDLRNSR